MTNERETTLHPVLELGLEVGEGGHLLIIEGGIIGVNNDILAGVWGVGKHILGKHVSHKYGQLQLRGGNKNY